MRIYKSEKLRSADVIFPDLSYKIVGCAYDVHNQIGGELKEKSYQKAMFVALRAAGLAVKQQVHYQVKYKEEPVGKYFFDFLVEDKIIVEIKVKCKKPLFRLRSDEMDNRVTHFASSLVVIKSGYRFPRSYVRQVVEYLKVANLKLAILINFGADQVVAKRILNSNS